MALAITKSFRATAIRMTFHALPAASSRSANARSRSSGDPTSPAVPLIGATPTKAAIRSRLGAPNSGESAKSVRLRTSTAALRCGVKARRRKRNAAVVKVVWQFATAGARVGLKKSYPTIQPR